MAKSTENYKVSAQNAKEFRGKILGWYDVHRRVLPWRVLPGQVTDPYRVWLSEIMLQQTTVQAVKPYFEKFTAMWPSVQDLAVAETSDVMSAWAGLGYYARARNLHACAQVVSNDLGGVFPNTQDGLLALPGIGDYTSAAIMTIAFNKPATVVDGNIERIMARYFAVTDPVPASKPLLKKLATPYFENFDDRPGDLAQALMDIGATICTPKSPKCMLCPISDECRGRAQGIQETLPARLKKKKKPQRRGFVYWVENGAGSVLLHRRPDKGLLGGTLALPTSDWVDIKNGDATHSIEFLKHDVEQISEVHHVFTHFELFMPLHLARVKNGISLSDEYFWQDVTALNPNDFPTVFKKAVKLAYTK